MYNIMGFSFFLQFTYEYLVRFCFLLFGFFFKPRKQEHCHHIKASLSDTHGYKV